MRLAALLVAAASAAASFLPSAAQAQSYPAATAMDFLVQSNCLDARGRIQPGILPFQAECGARHGLRWHQGMAYRKHDWPSNQHRAGAPLGYQASDAYMYFLRGYPVALHTFEYGTAPYTYRQWDQGADGGDAVFLRGNEAAIGVSEDSDGIKWMPGPGCAPGQPIVPGWLSFQDGRGERIAELAITWDVNTCATAFSRSLTRWRSRLLTMPYLIRGNPAGTFRTETIVSEHYSHPEIGQSNAMERFWFARGLGKVRWEAWVNLETPGRDVARAQAQADETARGGRCPPFEGGVGPNEPGRSNWVLMDCRTWTNFDPSPANSLIPITLWPAMHRLGN